MKFPKLNFIDSISISKIVRLCEAVTFFCTACFLLYLLLSKNYLQFVTPRFIYTGYFLVILLICLGIANLMYLPPQRIRGKFAHNFTLLIPALLWLTLPSLLSSDTFSTYQTAYASGKAKVSTDALGPTADEIGKKEQLPYDGIDHHKRIIILTTDNYYQTLFKITKQINEYKGYTVITSGYVTRDRTLLHTGDYMIGRLVMTCCIADLAPMGFPVFDSHGAQRKEGQWYTLTGTIEPINYHGLTQPALRVQKAVPTHKLEGYIYP